MTVKGSKHSFSKVTLKELFFLVIPMWILLKTAIRKSGSWNLKPFFLSLLHHRLRIYHFISVFFLPPNFLYHEWGHALSTLSRQRVPQSSLCHSALNYMCQMMPVLTASAIYYYYAHFGDCVWDRKGSYPRSIHAQDPEILFCVCCKKKFHKF